VEPLPKVDKGMRRGQRSANGELAGKLIVELIVVVEEVELDAAALQTNNSIHGTKQMTLYVEKWLIVSSQNALL
jgi:hypothetical protein